MTIFIEFLGKKLAEKIGVSTNLAIGLIYLAIREFLGEDKKFNKITYEDLKKIIEKGLELRLKRLHIQDIKGTIDFLLIQLKMNQSLITLTKF